MPADLTAIRALLASMAGFTPGPWRMSIENGSGIVAGHRHAVVSANSSALGWPVVLVERRSRPVMLAAPDLHRHASDLADEVERLRAEIAALRAGLPVSQPAPTPATGDVWQELIDAEPEPTLRDLYAERRTLGIQRYGVPLQRDNGRNTLQDLREGLLDAMVYARSLYLGETVGSLRSLLLGRPSPCGTEAAALRASQDDAVAAERYRIGAWIRAQKEVNVVDRLSLSRAIEHGDHINDDAPPLPSLRSLMLLRDELLRQVAALTAEVKP